MEDQDCESGSYLLSLSGVMEICLFVLRNNAAPLESRNEACDITIDVLESKIPTRLSSWGEFPTIVSRQQEERGNQGTDTNASRARQRYEL